MDLPAGTTLGGYQITEKLGRGGMASVYKAFEPALNRFVALKVLPAESVHHADFPRRFRREAEILATLEHPSIVPIHAFGITDDVPWMAMRLIEGGSLARLLEQRGRLALDETVSLLEPVSRALDFAHGRGVVHRDVKPQNILVDLQRNVYLADFGIARILEGESSLTTGRAMIGTPEYMSPEQARGQAADARSDVYSLAVVAYKALTGAVPFTADTPMAVLMKHLSAPIPIPAAGRIPEPVLRVLLKGLAKSPEDRWPAAGTLLGELSLAARPKPGAGAPLERGASSAATLTMSRAAEPTQATTEPARVVPTDRQPAAPAPVLGRGRLLAAAGILLAAIGASGLLLLVALRSSAPEPAVRALRPLEPSAPPHPSYVEVTGELRTVGLGTHPAGVDFVDTETQDHRLVGVTPSGSYSIRLQNDRTYNVLVRWEGLLGVQGSCNIGLLPLRSETDAARFSGSC